MAVFYREGETKKRPGVYQRHENIGLDTLVEARDGICAIPIKASWGPLGEVVTNTSKTMLKKNYGDGEYSSTFTVPAAKELFNGGAVIVYTYRLGTGGKAASAEVTTGLTITAKYPGTADISVAVQTKLADPSKKEVLVYFGTTLVESIDFKADAANEGQNLVDAVNEDSDYITAAVTPEGTLPTTVPAVAVASGKLSGGVDPTVQNDDYSKAFDALEPFYFNTMCLDVDDDEDMALSLLLHEYIKNAYELGKLCIGVVGETSAVDFEDRLEHAAGFNDNREYGNEDVDRLVEEGLDAIEEIYWPISKWGRHHIILKDGSLSFNNVSLPQKDTSDTRRLELRDTAGDLISAYDKFPAIDEEWKRDMMYINDYVAVSPDEEKFAVVTSLGGILETFSIKDGELKNIATKYFVEPDFSMTKSKVGEVYSVSYDYDNLVKSFGDLYVTNDAVYAVYGGDRMFTSRTGSDNIAVFDWKGNPQKLIRTDYRIVTFFLDEEENTVYAVIWDSEMRPYIGRIRI